MEETIVYRVLNFIFMPVFIFIAYVISILLGEKVAILLGFETTNIFQFIVSIIMASCIAFLITLIIHYLYQLIPFLHEEQFIRSYHGVHLIFLYFSGMVAMLGAMEPLMIEEALIDSPFQDNILAIAFLVFFVILSNYSFYNSLVINNEFKIIEKKDNYRYLNIKFIYLCLTIILSLIFILRIFKNKFVVDEFSFVLFILISMPYYINKFIVKNKRILQ